jgi:ABC-type transporter Mla MlaB component
LHPKDPRLQEQRMLKIQRLPRGDAVVLAVSGRFDADAIEELRTALDAEACRTMVVDLEEVTLVDRAGVKVLAEYEAAGVRLEHCPEYARRWIDAEAE